MEQKQKQFVAQLADTLAATTTIFRSCAQPFSDIDRCLRDWASKHAQQLADALAQFVTTDIQPTSQSTLVMPWAVAEPYVFVVFRQDQFEKVRDEKTLKVRVAVTEKDKPNVTFRNLGPYSFDLVEFKEAGSVPNFNYKLVWASHNVTNIMFNGPEQVKAQQELTELWKNLRQADINR